MPTVCDALGVPRPPGLDGRSLVPLALGGQPPGSRAIFSSIRRKGRCVGDAVIDWPLALFFLERGGAHGAGAQLVDLRAGGPGEDLLSKQPRDAKRLLELLAQRRARVTGVPAADGEPRNGLHRSILEALESF